MKITLEQIDLLRKRANVSYEEAKGALEKCNGDIVEALVYLEKDDKVKKKCEYTGKFMQNLKGIIKKGNETKFVIKNSKTTVLNIPLTLAILTTIFATPFAIIGLILAILTKHKIKIERVKGNGLEINKVFDKMTSAVDNITSKTILDKNND